MAKIPDSVDLVAVEIRRLINHKRLAEATDLAVKTLEAGSAKSETQKLAVTLLVRKAHRPETGPEKWMEIGHVNYWLEAEGVKPQALRNEKMRGEPHNLHYSDAHFKKCISMYNRARAEDE
ncbi:hypothetical protein [Devosia sediminis]|uniref:Uncharacterized protein n=1 Tax=Devosia sediminis TaxID=2798801 RepID=A0A934IT61_9HYPH|nr:hypothetical protein [Devosia sediminis]MBJ3783862.1 hypothetical protein [Devosia sediminis]